MRLIPPVMVAVLTVTGGCSPNGPYCYEWSEAYSRGDAAQIAAAHQDWILAHLPEDLRKLVKARGDTVDRSRLAALEHLVTVNCELHQTLPVTAVLSDLVDNHRAGRMSLFAQ